MERKDIDWGNLGFGYVLKKQTAVLHRLQGQYGLEKQILTGMPNDIHNTDSFLLGCFPILYHFTILNTSPFWSFSQEKGGKKGRFLCVPLKKTNVPVRDTFFHAKCLTYAPHGARIGKTKAHRTIASASLSRLFVPLPQFRKWEIHTVFLHFRNFELEQKSCLRLLAELCGVA